MPFGFNYTDQENKAGSGPWFEQQPYLTDLFERSKNLFSGDAPEYYDQQLVADMSPAQTGGLRSIYNAGQQDPFSGLAYSGVRGFLGGSPGGWTYPNGASAAINPWTQPITPSNLPTPETAPGSAPVGPPSFTPPPPDSSPPPPGAEVPPGSNPFLDQLHDRGASRITDAFTNTTQPRIDALFGDAGVGGGSAHALATANAARGLGRGLADFSAQLYGGAYEGDQNRRLGALGMLPQLQQTQYAPGRAMMDAGMTEQQHFQNVIDANIAKHNYEKGGGAADWLTHYRNLIYPAISTSFAEGSGGGFSVGGM